MKNVKVTIIEDASAHFELMERAIKREFPDAHVHCFKRIKHCLACIDQITPDIIITDYLLPGMNGLALLKELKIRHKETPVVVLTGQGDENIAVKAIKHGAYDYIVKSADFFSLVPSVIYKAMRQNELKRAMEESQSRYDHERTKLNAVLASMVNPLAVLNNDMIIDFANPIFERIFGKELIGKPCRTIFGASSHVSSLCLQVIQNHEIQTTDFEDAHGRMWHLTVSPGVDDNGEIIAALLLFQDLTDLKKSEYEIRRLKQQIEFILGATKTGLDIIDSEFNIRYIDSEWQKVYGDPIGKKCYEYFMDRNEVCLGCGIVKAMETKEPVVTEEILVKEGNRPIQVTTMPFQDSNGNWLFAEVNTDITYRKRTEKALQKLYKELENKNKELSKLSKRLLFLQEWDRQQLSMELHDQIGQTLTIIKIDVETMENSLSCADPAITKKFQIIEKSLSHAIREVKRICHRLRPSTLDSMGLLASLRTLIDEVKEHSNLWIELYTNNIPQYVSADIDIALYRIAQESLTNTIKYAKATSVFINLIWKDDCISLSIEDDGIGFDINEVLKSARNKGKGLGLLIMKERVEQLKGHFTMESRPGHGSHLLAEIPLPT